MKSKQRSYRAEQMKFVLAFASFAAVMCCGCVWGHIERSLPLNRSIAATLVGEEVTLFMKDDFEANVTIVAATEDSLRVATEHFARSVHFDSVSARDKTNRTLTPVAIAHERIREVVRAAFCPTHENALRNLARGLSKRTVVGSNAFRSGLIFHS